jgi:hypothetical protein
MVYSINLTKDELDMLQFVYNEYDGRIVNITNKPGSSYFVFHIELP